MKILLGIQPTGRLHIGNYFGAIEKGLEMRKFNDVRFMIANYHAGKTRPQSCYMLETMLQFGLNS